MNARYVARNGMTVRHRTEIAGLARRWGKYPGGVRARRCLNNESFSTGVLALAARNSVAPYRRRVIGIARGDRARRFKRAAPRSPRHWGPAGNTATGEPDRAANRAAQPNRFPAPPHANDSSFTTRTQARPMLRYPPKLNSINELKRTFESNSKGVERLGSVLQI